MIRKTIKLFKIIRRISLWPQVEKYFLSKTQNIYKDTGEKNDKFDYYEINFFIHPKPPQKGWKDKPHIVLGEDMYSTYNWQKVSILITERHKGVLQRQLNRKMTQKKERKEKWVKHMNRKRKRRCFIKP